MREYISKHRVRILGTGTLLGAAVAVALLTLNAIPGDPPLGDCFGGALSQDPPHCYAMEQAQRQGVIDVEKVYDAGGILYLSLRRDEPLGDDAAQFLKDRFYEFYDRWPDEVPVSPRYDLCTSRYDYRECYLDRTGWIDISVLRGITVLPKSMVYKDIRFHIGGETARLLEPGWASWRQVWPAVVDQKSDTSGTPATFDVSDVDTTSFPNYGCPEILTTSNLCSRDRDAALAVSGLHWGGNVYVQYKNPPQDEMELNRVKETLFPCYDRLGPCTYTATVTKKRIVDGVETLVNESVEVFKTQGVVGGVVIIPVKYGPVEMAQWAEILDRFAASRGNTIGIMRAEVGTNEQQSVEGLWTVMWPLDSLTAAGMDDAGFIASEVRETIVVWGGDAQRIVDALPTLLPLLGIPVDAVGVVIDDPGY